MILDLIGKCVFVISGSAHTVLAGYWSDQLGKKELYGENLWTTPPILNYVSGFEASFELQTALDFVKLELFVNVFVLSFL